MERNHNTGTALSAKLTEQLNVDGFPAKQLLLRDQITKSYISNYLKHN